MTHAFLRSFTQSMNLLRDGERNMGELAEESGCSSGSMSRDLTLLTTHGLVEREARTTTANNRISHTSVDALYDLVCGNLALRLKKRATDQTTFQKAVRKGTVSRRS